MDTYDINLSDVYRYIGCTDSNVDEVTKSQVLEACEQLKNINSAKSIYKIFHIDKDDKENTALLNTVLKLEGNDIKELLKESDKCILLAVTLGQEVDNLIRQTQIRDMAKAVILDACANSLVEEYCNFIESNIKKELDKEKEVFFTDRFSAGYGDLPLSTQSIFCKVIEADKKIGINVSSTNLMSPKKSITAIIGIADKPQPMKIKGCAFCMLVKDCSFRKRGLTCGS